MTDQFVGARIRERRAALGLSQRGLADSIGLTSQQMIVKYEAGINAVSASLLYKIACAMGTSVDYFFDGFDKHEEIQRPRRLTMLLNLMRNFSAIESEHHRQAVGQLIRALAGDRALSPDGKEPGAREGSSIEPHKGGPGIRND